MMTQLARSRCASAAVLAVFLAGSIPLPAFADIAAPTSDPTAPVVAQADPASRPDTSAATPAPAPAAPAGDPTITLDQARELIKNGDYDSAIEILRKVITTPPERISQLREAYLLLIKTHVFLGNFHRSRPQGVQTSLLSYQEARRYITECLRIKELRHTNPDVEEYPDEMVRFFAEIRGQIFGSFRVVNLEPPDAVVLLDADTLRALAPDSLLGDVDIAIGPHLVVVRAKGYKDLTEEIMISAGSTSERSYRLSRKHGPIWYATIGAGAVALAYGIALIPASGGGTAGAPPPEQPLPGPPDPPSTP